MYEQEKEQELTVRETNWVLNTIIIACIYAAVKSAIASKWGLAIFCLVFPPAGVVVALIEIFN